MEITWLGHSCFRLRSRESFVVTDPCDKSTGYTIGRPTASVVTVSHDHPGHSNIAAASSNQGARAAWRRAPARKSLPMLALPLPMGKRTS